jgi:hypothetical protein
MKQSTLKEIELRYETKIAELNKQYNEERFSAQEKIQEEKNNFFAAWERAKKSALEKIEHLNKGKEEQIDRFAERINRIHVELKNQYNILKLEAKQKYIKELEEAETEE